MVSQSIVEPHTTSVVAWDIPSAVVAGERFRIKVGIKCFDDCRLTNSDFVIYDHAGAQVATGTLPADRWPGTTGLYSGGESSGGGNQHGLGRALVHGYIAGTNAAKEA